MAGALFSDAVISFFVNTAAAEQSLTSFTRKFSTGVGQLKSLVAGFVGYQGLRGAYNSLTQLVDVADRWHIPVEQVGEYANLFAQFGGNIDEATQSIETFQNMSKQLALHSSGPLKELSDRLGKNLFNKDYMAILRDLRDVYPRLTNNAKAEVQDLIGANAALRAMLESSNETWKNANANASKMGTISKENAQSIRDMRVALAELKTTLVMVAIPFLEALRPVLEVVRDIAQWFNKLPEQVKKGLAWGTMAVVAVKAITSIIGAVTALNAALKTTTILSELASGGTTLAAGAAALALYAGYKVSQKYDSDNPEYAFGGWDDTIKATTGKQTKNRFSWLLGNGALSKSADVTTDAIQLLTTKQTEFIRGLFGKGDKSTDAQKTTNTTTTDNRTYNLTFNGIQNPQDFVNAFQSVAWNGVGPTRGWNNGS